jgi:Xaa-Pro aminopeptidase
MSENESDVAVKIARLQAVAEAHALGGLLLTSRANFSWLSGGASNGIDLGREGGAGALLVGADGRCRVLADPIEMPRLLAEALAGVDVEPVEYPWASAIADPQLVARTAARVLGEARPIGTDLPSEGLADARAAIRRARAPLTRAEGDRLRRLGRDAGTAMGDVCRQLTPGITEQEIARRTADALAAIGARAPVLLVGADARIDRYRHPVPTATPWARRVMVVVCAEREGLVVALTRLVAAGPVDAAWAARTRACAEVFSAMAAATRPGARGADVFAAAAGAYAEAGVPGEERRHHQGGAIGYESRDWIAHPGSEEHVHARQAFAWNPTITGTKIEDTLLVDGDRVELLTSTPGWPVVEHAVRGHTLATAQVLSV